MKKITVLLMIVAVSIFVVTLIAQEVEKKVEFQYVGASKCKLCHNKPKTGSQFSKWEADSHSKAYAELATDCAKEVAVKAGVTGDPQKAGECLVCHVTAYDAPVSQKTATLTMEEGISCEACHGPGSEYKSMKAMKDIHEGKETGAKFGLVEPTKEVCVKCHNAKSPTYKEFVYEEAVKKIAHPVVDLSVQ